MSGSWILWSIVGAYITFIFVKGVLKVRVIHDADDYLVAGRNARWFLLFCTMGATVIGGGSSIGALGKTYEWGLLMLLVSTGWYFHFIFSGLVVAPQFREAKLYTVAGYFDHRFGDRPRFAAMILSILFSVFVIAAQMAAFGSVLSAMMPDLADAQTLLRWAILIGGALVVVYSTAGGLMAVIHTDIYQFIVLIGGFIVTLAIAAPDLIANWGRVEAELPAEFLAIEGGKGWIFLITTFLAFLLGETFAPGYATRYCIGKDKKETQKGIAGVGFFLALVFPAVLFFLAVHARLHFPNIEPQHALPRVIWDLNHPIVGAVMIAALLSAVMSSADSALNSATAIFVKDLFERQLGWEDRGDGRTLRISRFMTAALGLIAVGIAVLWSDIIGLLLFTYHVWAPAIILPVVVGSLSKHRSHALNMDIFFTMSIVTVATLIYRFGIYDEGFDPAVFGVLLSCVVFGALRGGRRLLKRPT